MLIFSFFFGLGSIPLMSHTFLKKLHAPSVGSITVAAKNIASTKHSRAATAG